MIKQMRTGAGEGLRILEVGILEMAGRLLWPLVLLGIWQASELAWWLASVLVRGLGHA